MSVTNGQDERRSAPRIEYRTTGLALALPISQQEHPLRAIRIWTENFSLSGALILSREPIQAQHILLKLLLPQLGDTIVECEVIHESTRDSNLFIGGGLAYSYGLKFRQRLSEQELDPDVRSCLSAVSIRQSASKPDQKTPFSANSPAGRSTVPVQSSTDANLKLTTETCIKFDTSAVIDIQSAAQLLGPQTHADLCDSLVPFLSAIGLIVVYTSYFVL